MVTRKSLGTLAGTTLVLFAVAVAIGNDSGGAIHYVGKVAWFSFLACALVLVVTSVATLVRYGARANRS